MVTLIGMGSGNGKPFRSRHSRLCAARALCSVQSGCWRACLQTARPGSSRSTSPLTFWKHWHKPRAGCCRALQRRYRILLRCVRSAHAAAGAGHPRAGVSGRFQHPAAFSGAGPTVAGLEAGLGPWLCLRPGGRVHDEPFGVLPHRRH